VHAASLHSACQTRITHHTSHATADAHAQGFLAKILVAAGTADIKVGSPIMIIVEDKAHVAAFKDYKGDDAAPPAAAAAPAEKEEAAAPAAAAPAAKVSARAGVASAQAHISRRFMRGERRRAGFRSCALQRRCCCATTCAVWWMLSTLRS
jgi:pyruvate/2-oxoglutarate dehydrogenase complex dihydrolipoamide acyltransferase (E2) component